MTFFYDINKRLKEVLDAPKSVHQNLNEGAVAEVDYSAKAARAGKDIGKPGKAFAKIAKDAGERYGSKERGEKVAGAVLAKLRAKESAGEVEEGLGSMVRKIGSGMKKMAGQALDKVAPSDEALLKDLQRKVGVPATGKKPMTKEEYGPLEEKLVGGQKKLDKNKNGKLDATDFEMLRKGGKKVADESRDDDDDVYAYQDPAKAKTHKTASGGTVTRHGSVTRHQAAPGHYGGYDPESHPDKDDDKSGTPAGEKRGRGRPKGTGKSMGAKGPSGKSKLMTKEAGGMKQTFAILDDTLIDQIAAMNGAEIDPDAGSVETYDENTARQLAAFAKKNPQRLKQTQSINRAGMKPMAQRVGGTASGPEYNLKEEGDDVKAAMKLLKKAGYKVEKAEQELDEKAVSKKQQRFMGMVHATQKGKKAPSKEVAKVAKSMGKKDAEDFAATKHKGLPEKKKEVEETTVSGSVASSDAAPKSSGKGGMTFGKGIYDSMNRELEQMIAESMNISMSMNTDAHGGPSKSLTVTATDEDAENLGKLLKMAGLGQSSGCGCGTSPCSCNSAERVEENKPDWPTQDEVTGDNDDHLTRWSGGLNKPKTTVAGDGQTTIPVTAVQVRESEEQYKRELRKMLESAGIKVTDEMLDEGWKEKLAAAGTAAALGATGLGMMGGIPGGQAPDTVSSMNAKFQQNRAEKAAMDQRAQAFSKINKDFSDQYIKLIDQRLADASSSDTMTAQMMFYTRLEKLLKQYNAMEESAGLAEQEQEPAMAPESTDTEKSSCNECGMTEAECKCEETMAESLARFRSLAGIKESAKPDYIDLDGDKEESMKKAAADKQKADKKVEESILAMTNLWRAYKG